MLNYLKQKENANTRFIKSNNTSSVKMYLIKFQMHISIKAMVIQEFSPHGSKLQFSEKEKLSVIFILIIYFIFIYWTTNLCEEQSKKKKKKRPG